MRRCSSSACTRAWNASVSVWHLQPHGPREQRGDAAAGAVLCPQHNGLAEPCNCPVAPSNSPSALPLAKVAAARHGARSVPRAYSACAGC